MSSVGPQSLRFKITLGAPSRGGQTPSPPPSSSRENEVPQSSSPPTLVTHSSDGWLRSQSSPEGRAACGPFSNFTEAILRGQLNERAPSAPPLQNHPGVCTQAPATADSSGSEQRPGERRYGGAIVRVSELRQQGLDLLVPSTASGTEPGSRAAGHRAPAAATAAAHSSTVRASGQGLPSAALRADVPLSQIFGLTDSDSLVSAARGRGRGASSPSRTPSGRKSRKAAGRASAAKELALQPDGSLLEHRWYMSGGRRLLVYGSKTYKGSAAHRLWARMKRHRPGAGGREPTTRTASAPRRGARRASATAAALTPRGRQQTHSARASARSASHLSRPLTLDLGDRLPAVARPPRAPPTKVPVTSLPAWAQSHAEHTGTGLGSYAAVGDADASRGLSAMSFRPSSRARAAATHGAPVGALGIMDDTRRAAPRPAADAVVVEITDSEEDGEEEEEEERTNDADSLRAAPPDPLSHAQVKREQRELCGVLSSSQTPHSTLTCAGEPTTHYFADGPDALGEEQFSSTSWSSFSSVSSSSDGGANAAPPAPPNASSQSAQTSHQPVIKKRRLDGHDVLEVDGWAYPAELLPLLTQQEEHETPPQAAPAKARKNGKSSSLHPAAVPTPRPLTLGGPSDTAACGLEVIGGGTQRRGKRKADAEGDWRGRPHSGAITGPQAERFVEDGLFDQLAENDAGDLFDRGDEIGGFRY